MTLLLLTFNANADSLIRFDINKQRADKALIAFAQKADQTIIFSFNLTKKFQANELKGFHSVQLGLKKLLKDSGLIAVVNNSGQLSIQVNKLDRDVTPKKNITVMAVKRTSYLRFIVNIKKRELKGKFSLIDTTQSIFKLLFPALSHHPVAFHYPSIC
ncbi:MAG: hypothetical protein COC01_07860 [Bacteroidetes bacterium]|nr:MAG: hypothetical protein COC01_07860 [Bacteroidota bacterium]